MLDRRRVTRNFGALLAMRLSVALASFAFFVFLASAWDDAGLGGFVTVHALFLMLQTVPLLGLHVPLVRDLSQRPEELERLASSALLIALSVSALLATGLWWFGRVAWSPQLAPSIGLVAAALVPSAIVLVSETLLIARERMTVVAGITVGEILLRTAAWVLLVQQGHGLEALFLALLAGRWLAALAHVVIGPLRVAFRPASIGRRTLGELLRLCPIFLGIALAAAAIQRVDFVVLAQLASLEQVSAYARPYKLYEAALMLPTLAAVSLSPAMARLFSQPGPEASAFARRAIRTILLVGLPLAALLFWWAGPIVRLLFSAGPAAEVEVLRWLAFVPVLVALDQVLGLAVLARHRQDLDLAVLLFTVLVYVAALVALVPTWGARGAALATAGAALVQLGARLLSYRRAMAPQAAGTG